MKKILITGATGFIGPHLYRKLKQAGHNVVGVSSEGGEIDGELIKSLDISDKKSAEDFFKDKKFDIVFHLAAIRDGVGDNLEIGQKCVLINGIGTLNILEQLRKQGSGKIIYASTLEVYGHQKEISLMSEEAIPKPDTFYGIGKILGEYYCRKYFDEFSIPYICLRFAPIYGKNQLPYSMSAIFIDKATKNQDIIVYGKGAGAVDLVFIEDVMDALILAENSEKTGIFNIGSDSIITAAELARTIKEIWVSQSRIVFDQTKSESCYNIQLDIKKARQELNYFPKYVLKEGLKKLKSQFKI